MFKKIISLFLSLSLIITQPIFAQGLAQLNLAQYLGQMHPSATDIFRPTQLRYFSYDNLNNSYRILLDKGDLKDIKDNQLKEEAKELMDYFLIGLALPNDTFWVNLRPDSPDNIIDPELEKTGLGKILLEADLQLKKDTASFTSPQIPEGKAYWDKLYKKAGELFGTENITIPTLTRPWIVPGEIIVRESQNSAYIYKATLKVMLEEDYLSRDRSRTAPTMRIAPTPDQYNFTDPRLKELNEYSTQIIRETIIPKITREVNSSKRYAQLRQVYYSLVLSRWFKARFRSQSTENREQSTEKANNYLSLIDSGNLTNLTAKEPYDKLTYFKQYQESFAQGEYNLKEPAYTPYGQSVRSYMSGGFTAEYMNFSGPEIKAETASNPVEQLLLKNAVILDNNSNLVDPEQPLALTASALTPEALLNAGTMPVKDFILINITEKSRRGFNDEKDLESILEACKSYMLEFSGKYVEAAKIRITKKEIEEITGMLSLYFNPRFTTRPENIAVAARYLSGIMENKFKENGIAEDFEKLGKEINNIVELLNKSKKQPEAVIPESVASREKVLEAKNIIVKSFNSLKDKNEAYQKYINASVDNIGILLEAAKEAVKLIQEGSNRLFKDEVLPFEAAHPDTFDLEKMAEIESFLEQLHKDSTASPLMVDNVVNILEKTNKDFDNLFHIVRFPANEEESIISVYDSIEEELEIWHEFQSQQIFKKEEFGIILNNTIVKLESLKKSENATYRIHYILTPAIAELKKLQGMQQSLAIAPPLTNEGDIINAEVLENISGIKIIFKLFSNDGEELIKRYPDSKELYEETEKKLKTYWETEETYDIQKAAEAALEFYAAIAGIKPGGSKVEPEIENKIKILQDTGIIINGVVEKIKFLIEEDIVELGKKVNTGVVPKDLNKFSRELSLKNSKATVNYILFLLSDRFKPYRGDIPESFIEDSTVKYFLIKTELEIFDFSPTASSAMAEGYIIDNKAKEKIENIKYALKMFPFKAREFITQVRNPEFKKELQDLYQETNKKITASQEVNDIIGASEAVRKFYATVAGIQSQESSIIPEVSRKLLELEEAQPIIDAVVKKMKDLIEVDMTGLEEVILNNQDIDLTKIESIIKKLNLNNLKSAALEMKELFKKYQPQDYKEYSEKWVSIRTELEVFDIPIAASPLFLSDEEKRTITDIKKKIDLFPREYMGWLIAKHQDRILDEMMRYKSTATNEAGNDIELVISKIKSFLKDSKLRDEQFEDERFAIPELERLEALIKSINRSITNKMREEFEKLSIKDELKVKEFNTFLEKNWLAAAADYVGNVILRDSNDASAKEWQKLANDIINYRLGSSQTRSSSSITSELEVNAFPRNPLGGIDFTDKAMRIGLERMGSFADLKLVLPEIANVAALDLDNEFKQIQNMALSGIRPADIRILEFAAACYYRGEFSLRLGEITSCLQQAHFLDERLGRESSPALRLATMLPEVL